VSDQSFEKGVTGSSDHEQNRAEPDEGVGAPLSRDSGEAPQISIFDGKGNESVAVLSEDDEGRPSQGAGPTAEAAREDAKDAPGGLSDKFGNVHG